MKVVLALVLVMMVAVGLVWSEEKFLIEVKAATSLPVTNPSAPHGIMEELKGSVEGVARGPKRERSVSKAWRGNGGEEEKVCACIGCACNSGSVCPISVAPNSEYTLGMSADQAPYGVVVSDFEFETNDGSGFDIVAMDAGNYTLRSKGQSYFTYAAFSETKVTCFNGANGRTANPGFFVVASCRNHLSHCSLRFSLTVSINSAPLPIPIARPLRWSNAPPLGPFAVLLAFASIALTLLAL